MGSKHTPSAIYFSRLVHETRARLIGRTVLSLALKCPQHSTAQCSAEKPLLYGTVSTREQISFSLTRTRMLVFQLLLLDTLIDHAALPRRLRPENNCGIRLLLNQTHILHASDSHERNFLCSNTLTFSHALLQAFSSIKMQRLALLLLLTIVACSVAQPSAQRNMRRSWCT